MDNWIIKQQIDFMRPTIQPGKPDALMLPGDNLAHTWQVACLKNNIPVDLSGMTVTAYFLRTDGNAVMVTGEATGNIASVTLTQECYAFAGGLRAVMRITDPETEAVVSMAEHAFVVRPAVDAGGIIDPGEVIPSIDELIAKIDEMEEATAAAEAAATKSVRYDAAQTISAEGQEIARNNIGVESGEDTKANTGAKAIKFKPGYIGTNTDSIDFDNIDSAVATSSIYRYAALACAPGDAFTITCEGGSTARPYAFYGDRESGYQKIYASTELTLDNRTIIAPEDSAYIIINDKSFSNSFVGVPIINKVTVLEENIDGIGTPSLGKNHVYVGTIGSGENTVWLQLSNESYKYTIIPVKSNDVFEIIGGSNQAYIAFLKSYAQPLQGTNVDLSSATGFTQRLSVSANNYRRYVVPDDVNFIFIQLLSNNIDATPSMLTINGYDCSKSMQENIAATNSSMATKFEMADIMPFGGYELHYGNIATTGKWASFNGLYKTVVFPVKAGAAFTITGSNVTLYAVLKSKPIIELNAQIPYSDNAEWNSRKDASTTPSGTLPDDAKYMAIVVLYNGEDSSPTSLVIDGIDYVKTVYENMRDLMSKVNMIMARLNIE